MWVPRLLTFGPALLAVAVGGWLWQSWRQQPVWQPADEGPRLGLQQIAPLDEALRDPGWAWLWRGEVGRPLLRVDEAGRIRPDLVTGWRAHQTTRIFFRRPEDAGLAADRLRELGAERWVAWGLAEIEVIEDELRIRFDRSNEQAAEEVADLVADLSVISLARLRVAASDHAEQLAREFIEEGTELAGVKALWLDGFEAFELIVAGGAERVERELATRLSARTRLQPTLEMTALGRWLDEVVLEFDLDPEARWHDGRPFTGRDVVELTDRWRAGVGVVTGVGARIGRGTDPAEGPGRGPRGRDWPGFDLFRRIISWERVEEHRVALRLWQPQGSLLAPWTEVPVLRRPEADPAGESEGSIGPGSVSRLIGCGPVELVEWLPGERVVLRRFDFTPADAGGGGVGEGGERPTRGGRSRESEVVWLEAGRSPRRERWAELGLLHGIETRAGEFRPLVVAEDSPLRGWPRLETRRQADWWLIWMKGPAAESGGDNASVEGLDEVEVRRWLMRQWDEGALPGEGWRLWQPWWLDEDEAPDFALNDEPQAPVVPVAVRLRVAGEAGRGAELQAALGRVWQRKGVEVVADFGVQPGIGADSAPGLQLEAWLVRLRSGDPTAVLGWWHGPARADGGDARMDELLLQFGESLEDGRARQRAQSIDLRVERLGWGRPLALEVGELRGDPEWLLSGDHSEVGRPGEPNWPGANQRHGPTGGSGLARLLISGNGEPSGHADEGSPGRDVEVPVSGPIGGVDPTPSSADGRADEL